MLFYFYIITKQRSSIFWNTAGWITKQSLLHLSTKTFEPKQIFSDHSFCSLTGHIRKGTDVIVANNINISSSIYVFTADSLTCHIVAGTTGTGVTNNINHGSVLFRFPSKP